MNYSHAIRCLQVTAIALTAMFACAVAQPQINDLRLPISLDADSTDYDGKSSMLMFRGLRLTQGSIGIEADEGRASKLDFEDSVWHFSGNVVIDTENSHIECDTADLQFANHQLRLATITGSPALFMTKRPGSDEITHAEAGRFEYDFEAGIIEFSDDATITEGGNRISSNYLVYNIKEQRINAQSGGNGGEKVRITYTPAPADAPPEDGADDSDSQDSQDEESADDNEVAEPEPSGDNVG